MVNTFRLLRVDEIECRISTVANWGIGLLLYKDARCDQNILDETVGPMNWQRHHSRENANCIVSIWDAEKGIWVEKEDTGTESNTEKEKGLASDSFKRACFNWGIGRELYTAPKMFVYANDLKTLEEKNGKWTCRDFFRVTNIIYDKRRIATVEIVNEKTGQYLTFGDIDLASRKIDAVKASALLNLLNDKNVNIDKLLAQYRVKKVEDLTEKQHSEIVQRANKA